MMNHEEGITNTYFYPKGTIRNTATQGKTNNSANKKVIFKNCAPFTNCISRISNRLVNDAYDIDVVMPM